MYFLDICDDFVFIANLKRFNVKADTYVTDDLPVGCQRSYLNDATPCDVSNVWAHSLFNDVIFIYCYVRRT